MADRFYLAKFDDGQPAMWHNLGDTLQISGVVLQGKGLTFLALTPSAELPETYEFGNEAGYTHSGERVYVFPEDKVQILSTADWTRLIAQTDDPEQFVLDPDGHTKILQRKARARLSGEVQQEVWARDNFCCMYCGRKMGKGVQLSVDHFVPLELGGANDTSNYLSACRADNKRKGNMDPQAFCRKYGYDYPYLVQYLATHAG
jgi:hypothetical protein